MTGISKGCFMKGNGEADVFIDGMHFQHIMENLKVKGIDYEKFSDKIANRKRGRTYYFDALPYKSPGAIKPQNYAKKESFLSKLNYLKGFQVEKGYVKIETKKCDNCGKDIGIPKQKKVDVLIATRLIERSFEVDTLVLIAGDADFVPAIEVAKRKAKIVLGYCDGITARELIQISDEKIELSAAYFNDCKR